MVMDQNQKHLKNTEKVLHEVKFMKHTTAHETPYT